MLEFILARSAPLAPFETVAPLFAGFTTTFWYNRNVDFQKIIAVLMRNRYFSKEISLPSYEGVSKSFEPQAFSPFR